MAGLPSDDRAEYLAGVRLKRGGEAADRLTRDVVQLLNRHAQRRAAAP